MNPTSPENTARINTMFNEIAPLIEHLGARWSDEGQYEDINEYQDVIVGKLPEGFNLTQMTKRPFGFKFNIGTEAVYSIFCNKKTIGWKRLK